MLSTTECGNWDREFIQQRFVHPLELGRGNAVPLDAAEKFTHRRNINKKLKLLKDVKEDLSQIVVHPWFYLCNKDRYPSWEGKHDTRVS